MEEKRKRTNGGKLDGRERDYIHWWLQLGGWKGRQRETVEVEEQWRRIMSLS